MLVGFSTLVVAGYVVWNLWVTPPEVNQGLNVTQIANKLGQEDASSSASNQSPTGRREYCYNILLVGNDDGHGNADTIMLLNYDVPNGSVSLVSIPRDTMVQRDWTRIPKINSAFGYGGVELLKEEIARTLGVPIDYYVRVELAAFVKIVDALDGLDFYVPEDMYHDDDAGFVINLKQGQQHLTGNQVLQLVRYRSYQNQSSDIGRTQMQQQVLTALAKKVLSWNSLTKMESFVQIFNEYVETDLSLSNMLYFAQNALSVDMESGFQSCTLEGRGDAVKNGVQWCYELDAERTLEIVNTMLNPYPYDLTLDDMMILKAESYYFN